MKKGTLQIVLAFNTWPPTRDIEIIRRRSDEFEICVVATTSGTLVFTQIHADMPVAREESRSIVLYGSGRFIFTLRWGKDILSMQINKQDVLKHDDIDNGPLSINTSNDIDGQTLSFLNPDATESCKEWMQWRSNRYKNPKVNVKQGRRLKTIQEEVSELEKSLGLLSELLAMIKGGKDHMLGFLAVELRALLYWNGKNYSPLLLRMAGRLNLPLPIYFIRLDYEAGPDALLKFDHIVINKDASTVQYLPNQKLVDMQEWLASPVHTEISQEVNDQFLHHSVKETILKVCTILGPAHYDEDVPLDLEHLTQAIVASASLSQHILLNVAEITLQAGEFVLGHYKEHSQTT